MTFLLFKNQVCVNQLYYYTGKPFIENVILYHEIKDEKNLFMFLEKNKSIYTDCIDKPTIFDRSKMFGKNTNIDLKKYQKTFQFEYKGLYGKTKVYKISSNNLEHPF